MKFDWLKQQVHLHLFEATEAALKADLFYQQHMMDEIWLDEYSNVHIHYWEQGDQEESYKIKTINRLLEII